MLIKYILSVLRKMKTERSRLVSQKRLKKYIKGNRIPWTEGYEDFKWQKISESINDPEMLASFRSGGVLPGNYGIGLDERIVEYPFVFSRLTGNKTVFLDAGSTFNYESIITHPLIREKDLNIFTYYPENLNFIEKRISYQFGDLRELPYRNNWFDEIACISTIEHIGMDNTMYGYKETKIESGNEKFTAYRDVIKELLRVLKPGGALFLTLPFGEKINYGFFQQFNSEMMKDIQNLTTPFGRLESIFFKYTRDGWIFSDEKSCTDAKSFNFHTGEGKGNDGAAHSRAIWAMYFVKNIL